MSDGSFTRVQAEEIQSIRRGFLDFKEAMTGHSSDCTNCRKNGCLLCCPPITFLVCMTRNKVKIVPENNDGGTKNVYSGTCLDEVIMDFQVSFCYVSVVAVVAMYSLSPLLHLFARLDRHSV